MAEHRHLKRLKQVWIDQPVYFVTTCTHHRRALLTEARIASILIEEWQGARRLHRWAIGRYVIMPDHVHFFCRALLDAKPLSDFMQQWKQWSSKRVIRECSLEGPVWQEEFFDHLLRSSESYDEKWTYVCQNPVRAGLVQQAEDWPWQGEVENLIL